LELNTVVSSVFCLSIAQPAPRTPTASGLSAEARLRNAGRLNEAAGTGDELDTSIYIQISRARRADALVLCIALLLSVKFVVSRLDSAPCLISLASFVHNAGRYLYMAPYIASWRSCAGSLGNISWATPQGLMTIMHNEPAATTNIPIILCSESQSSEHDTAAHGGPRQVPWCSSKGMGV
jgi:hypothetical protein